ncbi:MAG: AAA family ATPase [Paracoccaceae bacterium]|nr:AAA family ATPase [Paracoccaceae bacterium]MDE3238682.1 AAA family ATPase [Paracoccaceae bacterium]
MSAVTLYAEAFGLRERPFTLLPDASFLYWSDQHKRACSILEFGILSSAPITMLTGEVGTGKTTLVQELLTRLGPDVTVALISNAQGGRGALLEWVLGALGQPVVPEEGYVAKFHRLQEVLIAEYAAGRRVVVIVDEAQNLSVEGLEEIRLLTNINAGKDELIQLVLVGQPELRDRVRQPELRQLAQRIVAGFHLGAMDAATVGGYIAHRLVCAGGTGREFTPGAARAIHAATGGVPRLVNQLADFALLYAWSAETDLVDEAVVSLVLSEGVFFGGGAEPVATVPAPGSWLREAVGS